MLLAVVSCVDELVRGNIGVVLWGPYAEGIVTDMLDVARDRCYLQDLIFVGLGG